MSRALIAGWFSFEDMGATAGDLLTRDLCETWLISQGWDCDVALAAPFEGGVDWRTAAPDRYEAIVFVCGPFGNGWPVTEFLKRFEGRRLIGVNLTMLEDLESWNPFDVLIERDSSRASRPDIAFLSPAPVVPVVGVVLVHPQSEYSGAMHREVEEVIDRVVSGLDLARVAIDTRLDMNGTGLSSPGQVEAMIGRMDAIITTRLHGTVLAIKNGVPPVVVDPISGGRKVITQARTIGWSRAFTADQLTDGLLADALRYCLSPSGRREAKAVREAATEGAMLAKDAFLDAISRARVGPSTGERYRALAVDAHGQRPVGDTDRMR